MNSQFNIALIGEVDAGKSTTLGQILLKTGSVLESRIQEADRASRAQNKDFEPAFLLDAFEYERQNEMTVDITSISCRIGSLDIRFLDTPGHKELSNKFIGGACYADLALLILDSQRDCLADHFRHARMLSTLGLRDFAVIINKWDSDTTKDLESYKNEISTFLVELDAHIHFISPISAKVGVGFDSLLSSLQQTLLSLKTPNELLVLLKKNPLTGQYWAQAEIGTFLPTSSLFGQSGPLVIKNRAACGDRIDLLTLENPPPFLLAVEKFEHIKRIKNMTCEVVVLQDSWLELTTLRTKWGSVPARFNNVNKNNQVCIDLETDFPFFACNSRSNLFTLEKSGRVLAVGIPHL